jgi:prepilin-type processing-associated H-X9-DG protein
MNRFYSIGRFIGPWLAFAALSGACVGFVLGLLVTIYGFFAGIMMLLGGTDDLVKTVTTIAQSFPEYALGVVAALGIGFVIGFISGIVVALIGGGAGVIWSILAFSGMGVLLPTSFETIFFFVFAIGGLGAFFPIQLIAQSPFRYAWGEPIGQSLRGTWLANPPQFARMGGIVVPILLCVVWEFIQVYPEYKQHQNYVARIGNWGTWQNSRRLVSYSNRRHHAPRSACQSNLKQVMLGFRQYIQDYDELYPPIPKKPVDGVGAIIQPYLKSTYLFQCPSEFYSYSEGKFDSGDFSDYWFNARLYGVSEASLSYISNTLALGDGNTGAGEGNSAYSLRSLPTPFAPAQRHLGGANYAYADGHIQWLRPNAISNTAPASSLNSSFVP